MDIQYVEFLLMQWGVCSLGELKSGLGRNGEGPTIVCSDAEFLFIDGAVSKLGLKNPKQKQMLKLKYLKPEIVDRVPHYKENSTLASRFKMSERDIQIELDAAFRAIADLAILNPV